MDHCDDLHSMRRYVNGRALLLDANFWGSLLRSSGASTTVSILFGTHIYLR